MWLKSLPFILILGMFPFLSWYFVKIYFCLCLCFCLYMCIHVCSCLQRVVVPWRWSSELWSSLRAANAINPRAASLALSGCVYVRVNKWCCLGPKPCVSSRKSGGNVKKSLTSRIRNTSKILQTLSSAWTYYEWFLMRLSAFSGSKIRSLSVK